MEKKKQLKEDELKKINGGTEDSKETEQEDKSTDNDNIRVRGNLNVDRAFSDHR